MSEHSILAPSDAARWSRCPGALHLTRNIPESDAEYSASGTCSHWILEQCLKTGADPKTWLGQTLTFGSYTFKIDKDRTERIRVVVNTIRREPGQLWVEKQIDTSAVLGVPGQMGHADAVKFDPEGAVLINGTSCKGVLSVHDFKDGYNKVPARDNLQGLLYLAGAMYELDLVAPIQAARFCIHQPVVGHYDEWSYSRDEIEQFIALIQGPAQLAYAIYQGKVSFSAETHLVAGEEQCYWCPARGSCPARARRIIGMFGDIVSKPEIDDEGLSKIYVRLDEIERACKDYRAEALKRALAGHTIDGQKLVQGKKGPRKWKDSTKAETSLSLLLPVEQIYEPRKLISPTEAEDLLSKPDYEALRSNIEQSPGSYSLAPISDKRPAVTVSQFPLVAPEQSSDSLI